MQPSQDLLAAQWLNGLGTYNPELVQHVRHPRLLAESSGIIAELEDSLLGPQANRHLKELSSIRYGLGIEAMSALAERARTDLNPQQRPLLAATSGAAGEQFPFGEGALPGGLAVSGASSVLAEVASLRFPLSLFMKPLPPGELGTWTLDELVMIRSHYDESTIKGLFVLRDVRTLLSLSAEDRKQLSEMIYFHAGLNNARMEEAIQRHDGALPLFRGPVTLRCVDGRWATFAQQSHSRLLYGCLPSTREFLVKMQRAIDAGKIASHTVQISGRLDIDFIRWAVGQGVDDVGPIPDIEILYNFLMPDMSMWRVTLKPARSGLSQKPAQDPSTQSPAAQQFTNNFTAYLRDSDHRRTFDVLAHVHPEAVSADIRTIAESPYRVSSLRELLAVREAFHRSVTYQLGAEATIQLTRRAGTEWIRQPLTSLEDFHRNLVERIRAIPDQQTFYPPEFFRLNSFEELEFCRRFEASLYTLCQQEIERVRGLSESDPMVIERQKNGYRGPLEGAPLAFDYIVMDHIITMRAEANFRARRSTRDAVAQSSIEVPEHIGRHYDRPDGFFGLSGVPSQLRNITAKPSVVAEFIDPLSASGVLKCTDEKVIHKTFATLHETNFRRMVPFIVALSRRARGSNDLTLIERMEVFKSHLTPALRHRRNALTELKAAREDRRQEMSTLTQTLQSRGVGKAEYGRQMHALKSQLDERVVAAEEKVQQAYAALSDCCARTFPRAAEQSHLRLVSIRDQHILKFIYSVNDRGETILDEEVIGPQGATRRSHSEQLGGRCMYAGGELIFMRYRESFTDYARWRDFASNRPSTAPWRLIEINNMSGHYQPEASTLTYARKLIVPALLGMGIETAGAQLVDRLAPGLRLRNLVEYRF